MIARTALALVALAVVRARGQPTSIWVDVEATPTEDPDLQEPEEVEKRYTPELVEELEMAKDDALLLYTEYTGRASLSLKQFIRNTRELENEVRQKLEPGLLDVAPSHCRVEYQQRLKNLIHNARRAATFSGENHHKFFLGHMIVFRMHLNKSAEYIHRSKSAVTNCLTSCDNKTPVACTVSCENLPKIKRYRRMALDEINRVRDDMQHSRRMYRDLLTHAQRKLNTVRRKAYAQAQAAHEKLKECTARENGQKSE